MASHMKRRAPHVLSGLLRCGYPVAQHVDERLGAQTVAARVRTDVPRSLSFLVVRQGITNRKQPLGEASSACPQRADSLFDFLEQRNTAPVDSVASDVLKSFDADGVHAVWNRALERRHTDAEGAITIARTLLETVCKHLLDETGGTYDEKDDLPALYRAVATTLNIAPSQHTEETFKRILGGATSVVEGLGSLRNKIGDTHGKGRAAVRPSPRHVQLAVNLAGAMRRFLSIRGASETRRPSDVLRGDGAFVVDETGVGLRGAVWRGPIFGDPRRRHQRGPVLQVAGEGGNRGRRRHQLAGVRDQTGTQVLGMSS